MRKASKIHNKKVSVYDEEEGERLKKAEGKKAILRAEFEKHKKEMVISVSEASKMNEIKLKNTLEELLNLNERKQKDLERLENTEQYLEKHNTEATQFFETVSRFEFSKHSDACLTVGYHPNRTTSSIWEMKGNNAAEKLGEKMADLMETLANVELLLEEEDEVQSSVQEKYEEIKKDHILQSKKVNELTKIYDHANKRFTDLQRIEFLAWNKHAAASSDLKELKDDLRDMKDKEYTFMKQKEEDKKRETENLHAKQNEMSNVLIDLDKKRQELIHSQEEIKRLDLKFEEMRDKRKTNRIVTKYIETFNALAEKQINLKAAHQALTEMSARLDASNSPQKFEGSNPFNFGMDVTSHLPASHKRGSVIERNSYIDRIQRLYERHPEGPHKLANVLIERYMDGCYHEESLKSNYEQLQQNKRSLTNDLQILEEELQLLRGKNEYIDQGQSGSKILDSNEQGAIDSGMFVVDSMATTINQAKFEVENKREADNHTTQFITTEAFMMRCYMDSIEMTSRFSKLLTSVYNQSGGQCSEDMKELCKLAKLQTAILRRSKKVKPEMSMSQLTTEAFPELHRTHTENSSASERGERDVPEPIIILDLNEVREIFLSVFELEEEKATEFIDNIKSDVMIITFISLEDIKSYLQTCSGDFSMESNAQRAIARITDLRKIAIENMMQRFEAIYKLYSEVVVTTRQGNHHLYHYFKQKGVALPKEDFMGREADTNPFIKKAVSKKWQTLLERYDYDPARDHRRDHQETDVTEHNTTQQQKEKTEDTAEMNEESWDREDTKAKLNEIVGSMSNKPTFKGKREEDLKRLQAKKDKERQKQALENMTDDDFLNLQRRIIKKDGKDDFAMAELSEGELLRKAQADQAQRLSSSTAPLEELKRMIENSKVLAKIQILEKQKCATDGKRTLKFEPIENYIPHEPLKIQKSPSVNQTYNIRITRNVYTPTLKPAGSRLFAISTDRMTESEYDTTSKDLSFKTSFPKSASKFKPVDAHFDLNSEPTLENEKPHTQVGQKRMRTLDNFKTVQSLLSKPAVPQTASKDVRAKKLLVESVQMKKGESGEVKLFKNKASSKSTLPKLEKTGKKNKGSKKKKKTSFEIVSSEHDNLNNLLRLQTDPMLKMVYSPTYFTTTAPTSAYSSEDLGYRFDSFKFTTPGLLISEKI